MNIYLFCLKQGPTSDVLLSVNITVQLKQLCNSNVSHEGGILNGMFCAGPFEGGSDSCQGCFQNNV